MSCGQWSGHTPRQARRTRPVTLSGGYEEWRTPGRLQTFRELLPKYVNEDDGMSRVQPMKNTHMMHESSSTCVRVTPQQGRGGLQEARSSGSQSYDQVSISGAPRTYYGFHAKGTSIPPPAHTTLRPKREVVSARLHFDKPRQLGFGF